MWNHGMRTVVLQSGEWPDMEASWLCEVIRQIKWRYDMAVTLSVGERSFEDYKLWREAGADRYLLKIETTDEDLYGELHPGMSFSRRLECLGELNFLDYQTGSGNIVGLKGQSLRSLAADIAFFGRNKIDMIGIGPFISQAETPLCGASVGSTELTLRVLALTRIVTRSALMPTTTALETVTVGGRELGLRAGANVVMISFTPVQYRDLYSIYPRKDIGRNVGAVIKEIEKICIENGRNIDYSRGDAARLN
jgi:biotin synthase